MAFTFDLTLIACPKCQKENDDKMLEVIGRHEFPSSTTNRLPFYEIVCRRCNKTFKTQEFLSFKEI